MKPTSKEVAHSQKVATCKLHRSLHEHQPSVLYRFYRELVISKNCNITLFEVQSNSLFTSLGPLFPSQIWPEYPRHPRRCACLRFQELTGEQFTQDHFGGVLVPATTVSLPRVDSGIENLLLSVTTLSPLKDTHVHRIPLVQPLPNLPAYI